MLLVGRDQARDECGLHGGGLARGQRQQGAAQRAPMGFERTVLLREPVDQFAQAHRVGAGHRFQQRRKQVLFLVRMVGYRSLVEVAQHRLRGLLRLRVGAVQGQVRQQACQRVALLGDALVAGGQHLQRHFEAGDRTVWAGQADRHHGAQHAMGAPQRGGEGHRAWARERKPAAPVGPARSMPLHGPCGPAGPTMAPS